MNNLPDIIRNGFFKRVWTFIRNVFIKETNIKTVMLSELVKDLGLIIEKYNQE